MEIVNFSHVDSCYKNVMTYHWCFCVPNTNLYTFFTIPGRFKEQPTGSDLK